MQKKQLFKTHLIIIILGCLLWVSDNVNAQGVGINQPNPDTSAILDIVATNRGILVPRMTTSQRDAIVLPATGLLIYNTDDNSFYYNRGTPILAVWESLSAPQSWEIRGNSGTIPTLHYIGTNDSVDFVMRTDSTARMGITSDGRVTINNPNPDASAILDITATNKGILLPRMTDSEYFGITDPAIGLLVYDSIINQFVYYDGIIWTTIGGDNDWTKSGNTVYNTTDSIGIGTSAPGKLLSVSGSGGSAIMDIENTQDSAVSLSFTSSFQTWRIGQNRPPDATGVPDAFFIYNENVNSTSLLIAPDGNTGIGTTAPNTALDVNGDLALRVNSFTAINGNNNDITIGNSTFIRITGPTQGYNITGIAGGVDGKMVILFNNTTQGMTIEHQSTLSGVPNRIIVSGGLAKTVGGEGICTLIYSNADQRWVVLSIF